MIAVVRLYRQHDLDLITLYYNEKIQLGRLIKKVLLNYVSETDEPMVLNFEEPESTTGYIPKCVRIHINLNESNEADNKVIALLKEIKPGYKCSFIKALFRNTCAYLPMVAYTTGSDFAMRKTLRMVSVEPVQSTSALAPASITPAIQTVAEVEEKRDITPVAPVLPELVKVETTEPKVNEQNGSNLDDLFDSFNKLG